MKKKKKVYHLKHSVKVFLFIIMCLGIVGFFVGRFFYQKHLDNVYKESYEYKLLDLGYKQDQVDNLLKYLSDDELSNVLTYGYNEFIPEFVKTKYFMYKNLDGYLSQVITQEDDFFKYHGTEGYDYEKLVSLVNVHYNEDKYSGDYKADTSLGNAILVNKYYALDESYVPDDLVDVDVKYYYGNKKQIKSEVYNAFLNMWNAANNEQGIYLVILSGYVSYQDSYATYSKSEAKNGTTFADKYYTRAGYSEHQTGLALDIFSKTNTNRDTFDQTDVYTWLVNNSYKYGFILRYAADTKKFTGNDYEPWHFRYLGVELATKVHDSGLTYDEYYAYYIEGK